MKKFSKILLVILVACSLELSGYVIGVNSAGKVGTFGGANDASKQQMVRISNNVQSFEEIIQKNFFFPYEDKQLEDGIYKGLFSALKDPYSVYYTGEEYQRLMEETTGEFSGIGIVVNAAEGPYITVVSPIAKSPADRAGIRMGDKIIAVDGETYSSDQLEQAVSKMRGKEGTKVKLTIRRTEKGQTKDFDVEVQRENIHIDSVTSTMLPDHRGYVQIRSFEEKTAEEFKTHVESLQKQGATGIILDLRGNPGGLLSSCVEIADYLLPEVKIVTTVDKQKEEHVEESDKNENPIPMVVLVNGGSASASEILTGALKDNHRAEIIGTKTFGKGIVQRLFPLGETFDGAGFKLTVAEYLTPNGTHIHGVGITPDIVLELPEEVKQIGPDALAQDVQLQRAMQELDKARKEGFIPERPQPAGASSLLEQSQPQSTNSKEKAPQKNETSTEGNQENLEHSADSPQGEGEGDGAE